MFVGWSGCLNMKFVGRIKNKELRDKVVGYFRENSEIIKATPTSITGKYHPPDEDKPGALIRHGDKVAWFCIQVASEFRLSSRELDVLIVAAYMHDIANATVAQGWSKIFIATDEEFIRGVQIKRNQELALKHAHFSAREVCNWVKGTLPHEDLVKLYYIIERHMAHWYPEDYEWKSWEPELPETFLEKMFALADYVMSRRNMTVVF